MDECGKPLPIHEQHAIARTQSGNSQAVGSTDDQAAQSIACDGATVGCIANGKRSSSDMLVIESDNVVAISVHQKQDVQAAPNYGRLTLMLLTAFLLAS